MKRGIVLIIWMLFLAVPVNAMEFTAPDAPPAAQKYMSDETENFGEGLRYIIRSAVDTIEPSIREASQICICLIAASVFTGLFIGLSGSKEAATEFVGTVIVGILLIQPADAMIHLGTECVVEVSQYGKLLVPVMTGAMAAQGGVTKSGALYAATTVFDAILTTSVAELLVPMLYIFLCIAIVRNLFGQPLIKDLCAFLKWLITWGLKTVLYIFTGYISITGVVSGTTDASLLKATKLTISGTVPVVGSILADASEAVLVSAGLMKNAAGVYGLLAVIAIGIGPFVQIWVQYLLLKITAGISEMLGTKKMAGLMKDFATAMGLVLAMTGTVCMIFLISTICYLKGAS